MNHFYSADSPDDIRKLLQLTKDIKSDPLQYLDIGRGKVMVLLFFNPSLRTKVSTQKAAMNLGMQVISMDMKDSWAWEFEDNVTMNTDKAEHIKEAAQVICSYADIIGIRSFPTLDNYENDYQDRVIRSFMKYASKPVINMESTIRHPLQSLADLFTIGEVVTKERPKIVLSWAPHPKALPQAVSNSFLEWMHKVGHEVTVTHPKGYELDDHFMNGHHIEYDQGRAFVDADVIYVKNWSSVSQYGQVLDQDRNWMITKDKLRKSSGAKLLHCLPVRRNVVIADDAMESEHSSIIRLAENRLYTAQAVIYSLLTQSL